LIIRYFLKKK